MPFYLLTVEDSHRLGSELKIMPTVRIRDLIERAPDLMTPMPGDTNAMQCTLEHRECCRAILPQNPNGRS